MKVNLLILFIPLFSLSQVGVRNAFDNRGLSNYYFNITNNEKKILNNNPYFTPLYNGYRYNARLDLIVDSLDNILNIDKIKLGKLIFVKKEYFKRWKKSSSKGYLIDLGENNYIRIQKILNSYYNPRLNSSSNKKFEEKITYFRKLDDKIKQIKKNEDSFVHFYLFLGLNHSRLKNYFENNYSNRNSVYYGLGIKFPLINSYYIKSHLFYSKYGGVKWFRIENESGRDKIVFNSLDFEILVEKKLKTFNVFIGIRSNYAVKREQILLSRKWYGFTFRDNYTNLNDELKIFIPYSGTLGFSFPIIESVQFELKHNFGMLNLQKNLDTLSRMNSFQSGIIYEF